jgi:DMSO/TMAO reductase YedYZ molybdopterin-dependent catalytic subunit
MHRRYFITLLTTGMLTPRVLRGEHHVISADPLEMEFDLASLQGEFTPLDDFYVRDHFASPAAAGTPTLSIEGEVEKPQHFTSSDLEKLNQRNFAAVLECAGNRVGSTGLVSNGAWAGWPLKDVLILARPTPAAVHLHLIGRDGYQRSVPLQRALADGMLATHLDSRALTLRHGAPWRALFPGWYGMDAVKWLERIVVATTPLPPEGGTYLESRETSSGEVERQPLPRIQVKSVITSPQQDSVLRRGSVEIRGLAWSGAGQVISVEVSVDSGKTWQPANLGVGTDFGWTLWKITMELTQPGPTDLVARAKDAQGQEQPPVRDSTRLDGYTNNWYHRVHCVVV